MGKRINVDRNFLRGMGIPMKKFPNLNKHSVLEFVFVTGSIKQYFIDSKDTVAGIQKFFPGYRILYYDLGDLDDYQRAQVMSLQAH